MWMLWYIQQLCLLHLVLYDGSPDVVICASLSWSKAAQLPEVTWALQLYHDWWMLSVHSHFSSTENEKLSLKPLSLQIRTQIQTFFWYLSSALETSLFSELSVTFLITSAKHRLLNSFMVPQLTFSMKLQKIIMVTTFWTILNSGSVLSGSCIGLTGEGSQRLNVPGWMDNKDKLWSLKTLAGRQVFLLIIWTMIGSIGVILKKILLNPWDLMGQTEP